MNALHATGYARVLRCRPRNAAKSAYGGMRGRTAGESAAARLRAPHPLQHVLHRARGACELLRVRAMGGSLIPVPVAPSRSCMMASARGSTSIDTPNAFATQSAVMWSWVGPIPPVVKPEV